MIGAKKMIGRLAIGSMLAVLCALSSAADFSSHVSLTCTPLFLGGDIRHGVRVEVENNGPTARGELTLTADGGKTSYPIELPQGVKKAFDAYPLVGQNYPDVQCDLITDLGSTHFNVPYGNIVNGPRVLEITDAIGGLQFLKPKTREGSSNQFQTQPLYVKPDDAPTRLLAYRSLAAIILGPGAERMPDEAVQAITLYVQTGGRLIFCGGSSVQSLMDRRWGALLPLSHPRSSSGMIDVTAPTVSAVNAQQPGTPTTSFHEEGATVTGAPVSGASMNSRRTVLPYGMGLVTVVPFDLFEGPIHTWPGLVGFIGNEVLVPTGDMLFSDYDTENDQMNPYGVVRTSQPVMHPSGPPGGADPFSFQAPRPESMAWIIFAYLVLVAPVNFLILRRLRKAELAWFTTPLISVVFAVVLLQSAGELYGGALSTASIGTLLVTEDSGKAVFRGASQMFFPKGGTYDLKLSDVDWLVTANQGYVYSPMAQADDLEAVDGADLQVPGFSVRNLQFKSIRFEQTTDSAGWFSMTVKRSGDNVHVAVTNHSPFPVESGTLSTEGGQAPLLRLESGQTASVDIPVIEERNGDRAPNSFSDYAASIHRVVLQANLVGFRPGPQIGKEVGDRTSISLIVVGDKATGGAN